jgi:glycine cleavage system H protein
MRPDDRKYTKSHEWVKLDGDTALIGITDHAVNELCSGNEGDLVYCDLPEAGRQVEAGETVERNLAIEEHLEILSSDPWEQGWMIRIKPRAKALPADLMSAEEYERHIAGDA